MKEVFTVNLTAHRPRYIKINPTQKGPQFSHPAPHARGTGNQNRCRSGMYFDSNQGFHKPQYNFEVDQKRNAMNIYQETLSLAPRRRGFHLITHEVRSALTQISQIQKGICQVFIQHTSAGLTINENADPTVRHDFEVFFNKAVPEDDPDYKHDDEGSDDMPAHIKASLLGSSVTIPIRNGKLALGIWQGIYLCEHRNQGGSRNLVITAWGE
jgi:secondary thiamine-phosphate synthase enzyme